MLDDISAADFQKDLNLAWDKTRLGVRDCISDLVVKHRDMRPCDQAYSFKVSEICSCLYGIYLCRSRYRKDC